MITKKYLIQLILPLIVLQSISYKLLSNILQLEFIEFTGNFFFQAYSIFLIIRTVNCFLIIANHKIKRSFFHFTLLAIVEFSFMLFYHIETTSIKLKFSDTGYLSPFFGNNFYALLVIQLLIIIGAVSIYRSNAYKSNHMHIILKSLFYLLIPFLFWVGFKYSQAYSNIRYCTSILNANNINQNQGYVEKSGLIGLNANEISSFSHYTFLPSHKYLVYFMDSDCKSCLRGLENIKKFERISGIKEVVYYDVKNKEGLINTGIETNNSKQLSDINTLKGESSMFNYIPIVPALFIIDNQEIKNIYLQSMPTIYELDEIFPNLKIEENLK